MYEDCVSLALLVGTLDHLGILIDPEGLGCLNSGILQSLSSSTLLLFFPVAAKKVAREEQDHTDDATNHCSRDGTTIGGFYDDFRHGKRFLRRNLAVLSFKPILANTSNAPVERKPEQIMRKSVHTSSPSQMNESLCSSTFSAVFLTFGPRGPSPCIYCR